MPKRGFVLFLLVLLALLLWWWWPDEPEGVKAPTRSAPVAGSMGTFFSNAATGPELQWFASVAEAQAKNAVPPLDEESYRLWPHLRNPEPTAAQLAAVRAQWAEFAQLYPDNIYLPSEFQKPKSEAEIKAAKERLDTVSAAMVDYNALRSATKWLGPGEKPPPITLSAEQMVAVLDYKIMEMQSRLQLLDHYLKSGSPDAEMLARAQQDIAQWKKELNEMQQAKANVPVR